MPGTDTQHDSRRQRDAHHRTSTEGDAESIAITVFGRLALLRAQVDAGLDDETADRQYLLEAVNAELVRILDQARADERGEPPAVRAHVRAHYTAPWANAVVQVSGWPGQAPGQGAKGDPVVIEPVVTEVTVCFFGDASESEDAGGENLATKLISAARAFGVLLLDAAALPDAKDGEVAR